MEERSGAVVRAIVAADMVGSTDLRSSLGDERTDRLMRAYGDLMETAVAHHGGAVRRWMGDGMTATFHSASAALAAALEMRRAVRAYGRRADAVTSFEVRFGVSVGEVHFDPRDGEEHGIAVVEAARLERLAAPGEVLATQLTRLIGERLVQAEFEDLGTTTLKGLTEPVAIVRVIDPDPTQAARPIPGALAIDQRFPLVGRSGEVATALSSWRDATNGTARTVLVSGQPGIGKTRFVSQLAAIAHDQQALVLAGGCDPDLVVPYQPFATALAETSDADQRLAAAVADGTGALGALFGSRRSTRDDQGANSRLELFDAVAAVIEDLAVVQPVVLVLEDLHWAAPPTVQLLRHLVRRLDRARVLVVGTFRPEDVPLSHPLQELLGELAGAGHSVRLDLAPLGVADVEQLILARLPDAPTNALGGFARRVVDESGGNPFFVCELLHHLSGTGELARLIGEGAAGSERLPIPDTVRGVVSQRLSRMPAELGDLLTTAAVIGQTFGVRLLAHLSDRPLHEVVELLEQAERVALVQEADAGRFVFAHAIVRSTVLDRLSATRRSLAHARVAEALVQLQPDAHDQLAHHWQQAGAEEQALVHLRLAAERDLEAFAFESAAERFQQLVDRGGPSDSRESAQAWLGLGLALRAMGDIGYVDPVLEAGRRARRRRDADLLADAALATRWPGTYFLVTDATAGVLELGEDAAAAVAPDDPRRARILATLAVHDRDPVRNERFLTEAYAVASQVDDPSVIGHVLVSEYIARWSPASLDRRAEIIVDLTRAARSTGQPDLDFYSRFFSACHATEQGDLVTARRRLTSLHAELRSMHNRYYEFLAQRLSLSIDIFTGRGDQATVDALAAQHSGTHADTLNTWAVQTAELARHRGTLGSLVSSIESVLDDSDLAIVWQPALGLAKVDAGDRVGAREILDGYKPPGFDHFWLAAMQSAAELAVELDDAPTAERLRRDLTPFRGQIGLAGPGSLCMGLVSNSLGQLAVVCNDLPAACELLTEAVEHADRIEAFHEATIARRNLAVALIRLTGESAMSTRLLAEATETARQRGYAGQLRRLEQLDASSKQ